MPARRKTTSTRKPPSSKAAPRRPASKASPGRLAPKKAPSRQKQRALPDTAQLIAAPRDPAPHDIAQFTPAQSRALRELFWQNVIREILTSLSVEWTSRLDRQHAARAHRHAPELPEGHANPGEPQIDRDEPSQQPREQVECPPEGDCEVLAPPDHGEAPDLFDGRMAVILKSGERVPIGEVFPVFACGINTPLERGLSVELECTVFQIRTPRGQVWTVPLQEIRAFHSLSPDLMARIEQAARRQNLAGIEEQVPFGFAAFTSISRGMGMPAPVPQAPDEPSE